jgi:hypothetical protein
VKFLRVFAPSEHGPGREEVEAFLAGLGWSADFACDDGGWYRADLQSAGEEPAWLELWSAEEGQARAELSAWAAFLEKHATLPVHSALVERCFLSRHLLVASVPEGAGPGHPVRRLCAELARRTGGLLQCDGEGVYGPEGELLLSEVE